MSDEETGHYRCYVDKKFNPETVKIIGAANQIIQEYEKRGFVLTLRQLYYQFVARGWLPNRQSEYTRLGSIISDGRLAGLISWTAIEDRGRQLRGLNFFEAPHEAVKSSAMGYRLDLWANQDWRPEVWVEKAALEGVIEDICVRHRVDFFATRGYNSQSEQWRAGRRFAGYLARGQRPIVFHLGDHDPSGIDMTRDNRDRLSMFAGVPILVQRLALNMPQIEQYDPPPNPAKLTDSRSTDYIEKFGDSSWELDALDPTVISDLIGSAISALKDPAKWEEMVAQEVEDKQVLQQVYEDLGGDPTEFEHD